MRPRELRKRLFGSGPGPEWGIVLGSGFDPWLDRLSPGEAIPFESVTGLVPANVPGHGGFFAAGSVGETPVVIAAGRLHLYEGLDVNQVVGPVKAFLSQGISSLLLTTAVGSLGKQLEPGDGVVVTDQINLTGEDPHKGSGGFPDVSRLYDTGYINFLEKRGLKRGVLAGVRGPSYETPAEARALMAMGADAVCMSTVLEALTLAGTGIRCAALAVVANRAGEPGTSHEDVLAKVRKWAGRHWPVVEGLIDAGCG